MNNCNNLEDIITFLYKTIKTKKGTNLLKDTSLLKKVKFDAYIDSTMSNPFSFTIFELSDQGELLIDDVQKLMDSEASYFLFVNPRCGWIFAVENTLENQKKLIKKEKIQNYNIKILE